MHLDVRRGNGLLKTVAFYVAGLGTNPNADFSKELQVAAQNGHRDAVALLLDRGVDAAADDNEPLLMAYEYGHTDIVQLLLDLPLNRGVNPAAMNNRALRWACENGRTAAV